MGLYENASREYNPVRWVVCGFLRRLKAPPSTTVLVARVPL